MRKMIFAGLLSSGACAAFATVAFATPSIFEFNQMGYSDGGVFSGFFEGEDINGDGQIVSFDGEVTDFSATYESGLANLSFDFSSLEFPEFSELTGLVYSLDGLGTIGDDARGAVEGLAVLSADGYVSVGPGPANLCDGETPCGFVSVRDFLEPFDPPPVDGEPTFAEVIELEPFLALVASTQNVINVTSGPLGVPFGTPERPFLPDTGLGGPGGGDGDEVDRFVFEIDPREIEPGVTFFFDPIIAVGYVYEVTGAEFASVTAPTLAQVPDGDGQYVLELPGLAPQVLLAGETITFAAPVTTFTITGIDVALELDPTDPAAFVTGASLASTPLSTFTITQTPITFDTSPVPLPAGGVLLLTGMAGFWAVRRSQKLAAA